jgi:uncharacterized protein
MGRIDVTLVAGGMYHDIDFARLSCSAARRARGVPGPGATRLRGHRGITGGSILVSYTCDVRPSLEAPSSDPRLGRGGRPLGGAARHERRARRRRTERRRLTAGVPAVGRHARQPVRRPSADPCRTSSRWRRTTTGSSTASSRSRPTTSCTSPSMPTVTHWSRCCTRRGRVPHGLRRVRLDRRPGPPPRDVPPPLGDGAVLYNTLGHCRGHYDMVPVVDYYPTIERCSWEHPAYYELLRRSLRWARGETG